MPGDPNLVKYFRQHSHRYYTETVTAAMFYSYAILTIAVVAAAAGN